MWWLLRLQAISTLICSIFILPFSSNLLIENTNLERQTWSSSLFFMSWFWQSTVARMQKTAIWWLCTCASPICSQEMLHLPASTNDYSCTWETDYPYYKGSSLPCKTKMLKILKYDLTYLFPLALLSSFQVYFLNTLSICKTGAN